MTFLTVQTYHDRSKHHFQRYASGPDGLDWKNQPDPFRRFSGCNVIKLPLMTKSTTVLYDDLYSIKQPPVEDCSLTNMAQFFELSLGLSAWKQSGEMRWPLRCNPSSGNLHPTEAYLIIDNCDDLNKGVYHYVSCDHLLEQRCQFDEEKFLLPPHSFIIGLSSIHWREAWKYGERAFRYCQHDVGHAIAAIRYSAAILGWKVQILSSASDNDISCILGLDRQIDFSNAEPEQADVMLVINTQGEKLSDSNYSLNNLVTQAKQIKWMGQANRLSSQHTDDWPIIEDVALASQKIKTIESIWQAPSYPNPLRQHDFLYASNSTPKPAASSLIKQRRSAQKFDENGLMTESQFYRLLDLTLPRAAIVPMDSIPWKPRIHFLLFIHHVIGIEPGLYIFLRDDSQKESFKQHLKADFDWIKPNNCPKHLSLFQLVSGDARNAAKTLSCHQDIASDGVLSLAMFAEYQLNLDNESWQYRRYYWEAGILGQILYLEAEFAELRGTGIGCYFDDAVHELFGLKDNTFQSLYHFTIGKALEDKRLETLPPYAHLQLINSLTT